MRIINLNILLFTFYFFIFPCKIKIKSKDVKIHFSHDTLSLLEIEMPVAPYSKEFSNFCLLTNEKGYSDFKKTMSIENTINCPNIDFKKNSLIGFKILGGGPPDHCKTFSKIKCYYDSVANSYEFNLVFIKTGNNKAQCVYNKWYLIKKLDTKSVILNGKIKLISFSAKTNMTNDSLCKMIYSGDFINVNSHYYDSDTINENFIYHIN